LGGVLGVIDPLAERRAERDRLVAIARDYAETVSARLHVSAVVLAGSLARGDFNVWSDIDVVVVAEALPERLPDRLALLGADAPAGVQAVGYTPAELRGAALGGNRLVLDAAAHGIVLAGDPDALIRACRPVAAP
jgi:predicted nucleotidyltransferase